MKANNLFQDLASAPLFPLILRLSLPATLAQLVTALYSIVDRIYIGRIPGTGTAALTGLSLCFPIIMLITAFGMLFSTGSSALASIAMGESNIAKADNLLGNSFFLLTTSSLLLTIGCIWYQEPLLLFFGASEATLPYATSYLSIYLTGTIFVELSLGLTNFINAQGFTVAAMLSAIIGTGLNIILDPLFIYGLGMGIQGAAVATVISQGITAIFVVLFLCSKHSILHLHLSCLKPQYSLVKQSCFLGASAFVFQLNESIVIIVLNRLLTQYGGNLSDIYIASLGIICSIQQIFFMPLKGIVMGIQPITSYNFGALNDNRVRETIYIARILSITCAIIMWAIFMFLPRKIIGFFTTDSILIITTVITMRIMLSTIFVLGLQMINQNTFIAIGNIGYSFFFGILRKLILLIPLAFTLPLFFGIHGIFAAEAIANVLTTIITAFTFNRYIRTVVFRT